jgi:hypothetical protein
MADNLTSTKTFRRYAAIEGRNHPPIHPLFVHQSPDGDAISPDSIPAFTAVAATDLLTTAGHGLTADTPIRFFTTGTLPGGLATATTVYVSASGLTADAFKVSAAVGGSVIDITSTGTGTHTWQRYLTADQQTAVGQIRNRARASRVFDTSSTDDPVVALTAVAWQTYERNPKHLAWLIDDHLQRHTQWAWRVADHFDVSEGAIPPSASSAGTGGGGGHSPVPTSLL